MKSGLREMEGGGFGGMVEMIDSREEFIARGEWQGIPIAQTF
jgi:hypothetical protein